MIPGLRFTFRLLAGAALALVAAGPALATFEGPKVRVRYSLDRQDGGYLARNITQTFSNLGDMRVIVDDQTPRNRGYEILLSGPLEFTIDFTADPKTQQIVAGPVRLVDTQFRQKFDTHVGGGADTPSGATVRTEVFTKLWEEGTGTLTLGGTCEEKTNWDFITWDPQSYQAVSDCKDLGLEYEECFSTCEFSGSAGIICSQAAPPGGWPRLEPLIPDPKDKKDLPKMSILAVNDFADEVHGDNCTPLDLLPEYMPGQSLIPFLPEPVGEGANVPSPLIGEQDDQLENADNQATTFASWYGVELAREYCENECQVLPEPGAAALSVAALMSIVGLRWRQR